MLIQVTKELSDSLDEFGGLQRSRSYGLITEAPKELSTSKSLNSPSTHFRALREFSGFEQSGGCSVMPVRAQSKLMYVREDCAALRHGVPGDRWHGAAWVEMDAIRLELFETAG